uniref:Uncharacterized protein n=1 Tax=Zea mays TaxID=4577 RepID=A0A804R1Q1_MAIZE
MPVRGAFFSFRTHLSIFRCLVDHRLNDPPPEPPNPKIGSSISVVVPVQWRAGGSDVGDDPCRGAQVHVSGRHLPKIHRFYCFSVGENI